MAFSIFSVVGLVGMTGIIINDAIVLVTTVDEHSRNRGLLPAIVDGACDRLRPVLLTTLTTVLGLAPLLFERSSQAEFLKPTVITLVYGLGFGMVLVLLVVPALLAVQFDLQRMARALRRSLQGRTGARGLGVLTGLTAAAIVALFAATLGHWLVAGALPGAVAALLPAALSAAGAAGALGLFLAGALALCLLALALGAAILRPTTRMAPRPAAE
jgi:AcrR family transcriptional regulator